VADARSRRGRPRPRLALLGWFVVVASLHALWDAAGGIAVWLTLILTGTPTQWTLIRLGEAPGVTQPQVHLYTALSWGFMGVVALLGVLILWARWRGSRRGGAPGALEPSRPLQPLTWSGGAW
jgi:hypothetical protein